ncbi:MAG TPA: DnaA N-terminal domain-containing protein, partial [Caulobacteraceae bacterium]|nr:DnaA N-terminal domain-containing protein [Caulobacteraceae bacterium]
PPSGHGQDRNDSGSRRSSGTADAIGSPRGASGLGGASSDPKVYAEMVRQELKTAAQLCPRLAPLVTPALLAYPASATPEDAARVAAAAAQFLPRPERNNDQTALWGWRKHGIRVLVMLAIALEDPQVRSPCGYFGKLTGQDRGAADLRLNLARILAGKGAVPLPDVGATAVEAGEAQARRLAEDLVAPPGAEDPEWQAIAGELRRILREGKFGSWFSRVGFHGVNDGILTLSTPSGVAVDRIKADFIPDILAAAAVADVFVERVIVTLRKP